MKVQLTFVTALLLSCTTWANNGILSSGSPVIMANPINLDFSLNSIFFSDSDNEVLFIDFEALGDPLLSVNILRDDALMMEDDVSDLPANSIYEINLDIVRTGNYTIELVTSDGIVVHKEIWVE